MTADQSSPAVHRRRVFNLALGAVGVVFGDIGTSPLYALKEVFHHHVALDEVHVLGVLSLVFWSLTLVVAVKYALFIMRADNRGEGGIITLMSLALQCARGHPARTRLIMTLGLLGASLFYGDSMITPAISVLSAIEGLEVISPVLNLDQIILPLTVIVLVALFILQAKGTGHIGRIFAPVMVVWFVALAVMGVAGIVQEPRVLLAVNPYYAVYLLSDLGWQAFWIMGAVVLAITGAEALYADMGHFGLMPIRYAWFGFVFPALLLNYFGQGSLLIRDPHAISNPFYLLAPGWALYPLLILSTLATVIASQAVISGAFSATRQAILLGYCPRMTIYHTSYGERGQIYIPAVNWLLMVSVVVLVLSFQSSSALASAYGIAVTGTMITTTLLVYIVMRQAWRWTALAGLTFLAGFLPLEALFFFSNSLKIPTGGWLSLLVAAVVFWVITTWLKGRQLFAEYLDQRRLLVEDFEKELEQNPSVTTPGTAIYLTRNLHGMPQVFLQNFKHNHVLHQHIIVLTIVTKDEPYVDEAHRVKVRSYGREHRFYRIKFYFGFKQLQDVRRALDLCSQALYDHDGLEIDLKKVSFFVGREIITFRRRSSMPRWRRPLARYLFHNSASAIEFFKIPVDRVLELGMRVEL